jgi:hypothetical protein
VILNRRAVEEERFLRRLIVLVRLSGDKSIKNQVDVSNYVKDLYKDLSFGEIRDIMLSWRRIKDNPAVEAEKIIAELIEFYKD